MESKYIVYITDENYVMPTCVSIVSLLQNLRKGERISIYVFTDNVSTCEKDNLRKLTTKFADIIVKDIDGNKYKGVSKSYIGEGIHVSSSALFKFEIANQLPQIDTVLYLDGDVLINRNINDLFHVEMGDAYVAAVDDMGDLTDQDGKSYLASRIGLDSCLYFNTGVMILNLKKMREEDIPSQLKEYRQQGINYFMDQDAFNSILGHNRVSLPYKYNFRTPIFDVKSFEEINSQFFGGIYHAVNECIEDQVILHMSDKMKPWKYYIPWFTNKFRSYYKLSPYKDVDLILESPLKPLQDKIWDLQKAYGASQEAYMALLQYTKEHKIWKFPKERVPRGCSLVLYGAGEVGQDYYSQIMELGYCNVVLWVDRNYGTIQNTKAPELIGKVEYDFILIAIEKEEYVREVRKSLEIMGIDSKTIIESF